MSATNNAMFMALLVLAYTAEPTWVGAVEPSTQARVTIRIHRAAQASATDWRKAPPASRREIECKEADGRTIVIRIIEHQ